MASMNEKDYYAILGVPETATDEEIRKAFQQKARQLHPDVNKDPGAEDAFKEVSEAYAVLSDDVKRLRYNAMRSGSSFAGYGSTTTAGGSSGDYAGSPFDWGFPFSTARAAATQRSRAYRPEPGADITMEVTLDEEAAASGVRRGLTYQRYVTCDHCHGNGSLESEHSTTCPTCGGTGRIGVDLSSLFGIGAIDMTCPECEGAGRVVINPCEKCGGTGRVMSASELVVDIPENSHDGDVICIDGMGNAGTNGEKTGDFVCFVEVPSEHLNTLQQRAFYVYGFAIPLAVLGLFYGSVLATAGWWVFLALIATIMLVRGGALGHTKRWWFNALKAVLVGIRSGVFVAVFIFLMSSCNNALLKH